MCYEWDGIKPDIVAMGKAMSGGTMPVSAVACNDDIMLTIKPGEHGSTYGGNPLAMHVSKVAIQTLMEEGMIENSLKMGDLLQNSLKQLKSPLIKSVRGKGLFVGLEVVDDAKINGDDLAYALMKRGLVTKSTHGYTIRLAPALVIKEQEILASTKIIAEALGDVEKLNNERTK